MTAQHHIDAVVADRLGFTHSTRLKPALTDLTFTVAKGETVLVLGPSGSGKSTLTLCLDGLIPHLVEGDYEGSVHVAGRPVEDTPVHLLSQEVGLVLQDPESQFCTLTVEDEVAFGLENLRREPEGIERAIDVALEEVGLAGYRRRRLDALSGGEKQRVALASVLAMGPSILVLDEPSANLDPRATEELFALLKRLASDEGRTIFIIEHKLDQMIDWVDSVLVLGPGGRLIGKADPRTVFYEWGPTLEDIGVWRPQTVELVATLRSSGWDIPGAPLGVGDTAQALVETPGLMQRLQAHGGRGRPSSPGGWMEGKSVAASAPPILRTEELSYVFADGRKALDKVSMALPRGAFAAIAGGNGAGKTTLAALLTGARPAPPGRVFLEGDDITGMRSAAISERVGLVFQNPEHQFVTDTVFGELAFSLAPRAGRRRAGRLSAEQKASVEEWLERMGLLALAEADPFSLSHGQKRRLSVGAMLIRGQSAVVLDEPTLGQDELQTHRLMAMMNDLRAEGRTVAMVTHDMRLVAENAGLLYVLHEGRMVFAGAPSGFFSRPEQVAQAGLTMPVLGRITHLLQNDEGIPADLYTLSGFCAAAGQAPTAAQAAAAACTTAGEGL